MSRYHGSALGHKWDPKSRNPLTEKQEVMLTYVVCFSLSYLFGRMLRHHLTQ